MVWRQRIWVKQQAVGHQVVSTMENFAHSSCWRQTAVNRKSRKRVWWLDRRHYPQRWGAARLPLRHTDVSTCSSSLCLPQPLHTLELKRFVKSRNTCFHPPGSQFAQTCEVLCGISCVDSMFFESFSGLLTLSIVSQGIKILNNPMWNMYLRQQEMTQNSFKI